MGEADANGTLFISRYRAKASASAFEANEEEMVSVGARLIAPKKTTVALAVDISDRGAFYLNGQLLLVLDNSFRAKGDLFRGDFDPRAQILYLPLRKGQNELVIQVAERANGWGLSARLPHNPGIDIEPLD